MAKSESVSREYGYEASGRLASASSNGETTAFTYDAAGDLTRAGAADAVAPVVFPAPAPAAVAPPPPPPAEPAVRFCKKCGTPRAANARFCAKCGSPFDA